MDKQNLSVLISEQAIQERIAEMAVEIRRTYGDELLVLIGVLKGCFVFMADLARELGDMNLQIDFMQVSSYGTERRSSGVVQFVKDLDINIESRHVLLVEDIVDSGLTLTYLMEVFKTRQPASIRVVTLLSKPEARKHEVAVDFVGFEIPSQFVVGYGLDDDEQYRNLPYIACVGGA